MSLPQRIEIQMPSVQLRLSIDVGTVAINQPAANPQVWELPAIVGFQPVDLGRAAASGSLQLPASDAESAPATIPLSSTSPSLRAQFTSPAAAPRTEQLPPGGIAALPR